MIKQQKINLKDLKEEAKKNDCMVRNAIYDRRCYITDGRGIMIATEKGEVIIPIEEATRFVKEFAEMIFKAADILNKLSLEQKNEVAREVVRAVRKVTDLPLVVKLSPNAEDIVGMAKVCEEEGADGISLVNTFKAMAIDIHKRKPVFENIYAGLSGPAIKPIALRMVHEVCKNVSIPVMGMGGITTAEDAIEFIMAGATCIQVGTSNFINP